MKRGDKFLHKCFIDKDGKPLRCQVTSVFYGRVYWKQEGAIKADMYFDLDKMNLSVKEMIND